MTAKKQPEVITHEETKQLPAWHFSDGCKSYVRISLERNGAANVIQGWCEHDADMEPLSWDQDNWDETYFCVEGSLKVIVEDDEGNSKELVAEEGESIWLPAGFRYTLEPTGEPAVNLWHVAPVPGTGLKPLSDLGFNNVDEVSQGLEELADD